MDVAVIRVVVGLLGGSVDIQRVLRFDHGHNEEFDKQLEELGWSPSDMVTMAGMYIDRGMYNMKKSIRDFFREILELLFQAAALVIDTVRTFFLVVLAILGPVQVPSLAP